MNTTKIALLLNKFKQEDIKNFRLFLQSPYFNRKKALVKYYNVLVSAGSAITDSKAGKHAVYRSVFKTSPFNEQVYKNLSSELYSLAKEYLSIKELNETVPEKEISVLKQLEKIGADKLFITEARSFKKKIEKSRISEMLFYHRFDFAIAEKTYYFNRSGFLRGEESDIGEGEEILKFYLSHLFRQMFSQIVVKKTYNFDLEVNPAGFFGNSLLKSGVLQDIMDYFRTNKIKHNEYLLLLYSIMLAALDPFKDEYYEDAKTLLLKIYPGLPPGNKFTLTLALFGVCTVRIAANPVTANFEKAFDIIEFQLKKNILRFSKDDFITVNEFRNVFMIALRLEKIEWLKRFQKKYITYLAPHERENMDLLLLSHIKYREKDYGAALESAGKVKLSQFIFKIDIRNIRLFCFIELGHYESAYSLIASYKDFINKNKNVSLQLKKNYMLFLTIARKIVKLRSGGDLHEFLRLEKELTANAVIIHRAWFDEQMEFMKSQFRIR